MNFHVITALLTSIVVPVQGVFVAWRNPKNPPNRLWCLLSIFVGLWSLGYGFMLASTEYDSALYWARFNEASACIIPVLFLHFAYTLLQKTDYRRTINILYLIGSLLAFATLLTPYVITTVKPKLGFTYYAHYGYLAWPYVTFFLSIVILALIELWRGILSFHGTKKNQLLYVFIAGVLGFGMGFTTFPIGFGFPLNDISNLVFIYTFPITYAVLKHKLMDITVVIRRTLVYSTLTAFLTAGYFLLILIMERWFQTLMGYRSFLTTAAAAFLLSISFIPLKNRIQTLVDRLFFRGSLPQLAEERSRLQRQLIRTDQLRAVGTFAAGMAHEVRNPLSTLKTFAEHLPHRYTDPAFRGRFARLIPQEVEKIERIVQEVLTFAKPSPPQMTTIRLDQVTDEVLELLSDRLVSQRVHVTRAYGTDGACRADVIQIKQVILNLLLNSLEAMPMGGALNVEIQQANGRLALTIQDTGRGIPQEILPQLGTPFVTTKSAGTGLGLAIVHGILEGHGGRLTLRSDVGAGTTATVWLPAADTSQKG